MAFHEIRFPAALSFGSTGGPERKTDIVALASGHGERNTPWTHSRRRYDAGTGLRSLDDVEALIAFFEARRGQLHAFRWKDWADFKSCPPSREIEPTDQPLGVGDGETVVLPLAKTYRSGEESYRRPITKPVVGRVRVALGGLPKVPGQEFEVDEAAGLITFAVPPDIGVQVTAGFEFDVPVRFDTDRIETSVSSFQAGEVPSVPVIEVRL